MAWVTLTNAIIISLATVLGYSEIPNNDVIKLVVCFLVAAFIPQSLNKIIKL